MPFEFKKLAIEGVILITPKIFQDERGLFFESYKKSDFIDFGINEDFSQDNCSRSSRGVLRGLHYQIGPNTQSKLVCCTFGKIYDVAIDVRKNSKTFSQWCAAILDENSKQMLYVPKGFAHGFLTLSKTAEVRYKVSAQYCLESQRGVIWNDSDINIKWPLDFDPILSNKDKNLPQLKNIKNEELL